MDEWETELLRYKNMLDSFQKWEPDLAAFVRRLPNIPLNYAPTSEGIVALQVSLFVVAGCLPVSSQAVAAFQNLWQARLLNIISLPARLIYELWGGVHYARHILIQMRKSSDVSVALLKSQRLVTGVHSQVELPWGGTSTDKCINVMEFVRSLSNVYPETEDSYAFLCESCHPSFLRHSTWSLACPPQPNWSNPKFREHAHLVICRTLEIIERSLGGIASDSRETLEVALPFIERDYL